MPFMPFQILGLWFRGLLSLAIIAGGIYAFRSWYDQSQVVEARPIGGVEGVDAAKDDDPGRRAPANIIRVEGRRAFRFDPGWNRPTAWLAAGLGLLAWATVGRWIGRGITLLAVTGKSRAAALKGGGPGSVDDDPRQERTGEVHRIRRPDGTEIHVECYGPPDAPPIIWTHGWGADSTEWYYPKKSLAGRFRLIVWDEPGLGRSRKPDNNDYCMEKLADDLEAVLSFAGNKPAVLVGHSIGGMITLTFCALFPEELKSRVAGLILVHTTYTNPVRTTKMASLYTALEKPVLIPLMYLTIAAWPLVWLMNWLGYLNGSAHRSTKSSSFAGEETLGQLDFVARFMPKARPDVLARGMLGMIAYDATKTLPTIGVPTLVVVGDLDTTTLPEAGRRIADEVPEGQLATLSPARHMGLIEHHDRFDRLVAEFAASRLHSGMPG